MSFTNQSKNTASYSNPAKNSAVFEMYLRHGRDPRLLELENTTFNDVVFSDGTVLKDLTFAQLAQKIWTNLTKH